MPDNCAPDPLFVSPPSGNGPGSTDGLFDVVAISISDEITPLVIGVGSATFRMPFGMTVTEVRASLTTASSLGIPTFDINQNGTSILSTKLTVDVGEKTSTTATVPPVISNTVLVDDDEISVDIDISGTDSAGAKISIIGLRTV